MNNNKLINSYIKNIFKYLKDDLKNFCIKLVNIKINETNMRIIEITFIPLEGLWKNELLELKIKLPELNVNIPNFYPQKGKWTEAFTKNSSNDSKKGVCLGLIFHTNNFQRVLKNNYNNNISKCLTHHIYAMAIDLKGLLQDKTKIQGVKTKFISQLNKL